MRLVAAFVAVLLYGLFAPAIGGDYTIERGDVIEITVVGAPVLHRKAAVDAAGNFAVPFVGDIAAAGFSTSQFRDKVRDLLIEKNVARRPEVIIGIVEYRPVYVGGDVMKPGAYPFRFGMTARDAVTLAEGLDFLHLRGRDPLLAAADAKGDFQSAAVDLAKQTARVARIRAELAGNRELDTASLQALVIQPGIIADVIEIERQQLAADLADVEREKASLERSLAALRDQISALIQEENAVKANVEEQTRNLERRRDLLQRGLSQTTRYEESQRALAAAQSQLHNVQSRSAEARRNLEDVRRRLEVADDHRRIKLLQDLRESIGLIEMAKVKLDTAAEKVRFTRTARIGRNDLAAEPPVIAIYRTRHGVPEKIGADLATPLQPGDNIEVTTAMNPAKIFGSAIR